MVKITMKHVAFKINSRSPGGANLNKELPLLPKDVWQEGGVSAVTFAHIKSREPWLTQAVMGKSPRGDTYPGVLK